MQLTRTTAAGGAMSWCARVGGSRAHGEHLVVYMLSARVSKLKRRCLWSVFVLVGWHSRTIQ